MQIGAVLQGSIQRNVRQVAMIDAIASQLGDYIRFAPPEGDAMLWGTFRCGERGGNRAAPCACAQYGDIHMSIDQRLLLGRVRLLTFVLVDLFEIDFV